MEEQFQQEDVVFDDSKTNLLKLDMPIGRKRYFIISFIIGAIMLVLGVLVKYIELANLLLPAVFIVVFLILSVLMFLTVINDSKRFWDLCEQKRKGLLFAIILFLLNIVLFFTGLKFLSFVVYMCMILVRGKLVK